MSEIVKKTEYYNLPADFWDNVIYYEYFISHSGFVDIEPHITMWTLFPLSDIRRRRIEEYGCHRLEGQYVQTAEMDTNPITVKGIWRRSG